MHHAVKEKKSGNQQEFINLWVECLTKCETYCTKSSTNTNTNTSIFRDCADVADLGIRFMSRNSQFNEEIFELFTTICQECEKTCEKSKDPEARNVADVCHRWIQQSQRELSHR